MKRALLIALLLGGCPTGGDPTPVTPDPDPVMPPMPIPQPPSDATCATACAHAADMHCAWAEPTPKGATCAQVCENAQKWQPWDLPCRTKAPSCGMADDCEN